MNDQIHTVKISRHRHRSLNRKHASKKKRKFKKIIHTNVRPTHDISLNNDNIIKTNDKLYSISHNTDSGNDEDQRKASFTSQHILKHLIHERSTPVIKIQNHSYSTSQNISTDGSNKIKKQNAWYDDIGTINNHHRNTKKKKTQKCTKQCALISAISVLIIVIVLMIVLLIVFLTKSKPTINNETPLLRWNTTGITVIGTTSQPGNTSSQFYLPWDVAIDWSNSLYVSDQRNHRVQKILMGASTGKTVAGYGNGTYGSSLNGLTGPLGVVIDDNSNVYVADTNNNRVVYWANNALSGSLLAGNGTGGSSFSQLDTPYGLARDAESGAIYVTEYTNNRVMRFSANNATGTLAAGGNGNGMNHTQLSLPHAVHFGSLSNSLIIVNTGAHNIVRWILGSDNWTLVAGSDNGTSGVTSTRFTSPTDVTLDPMGNMYVADRNNHRIQFFEAGQSNATTIIGQTGIPGNNATLLNTPSSLTLDSQLNLYVVDRVNHRIQKFLRY